MCWAISGIRASRALGDITFPESSPRAAETSLWAGVLCFLDVALEVSFVNGVFRTASAVACAACTLAWMFYSCAAHYFLLLLWFCLISRLYVRKLEW